MSVLLSLLLAAAAPAEAEQWSGTYRSAVGIANVARDGRTLFYAGRISPALPDKAPGCPAPREHCRRTAYLIKGDSVLVGDRRGAFIFATHVDARGRATEGWLPLAALAFPKRAAPRIRDWVGKWHRDEGSIEITRGARGVHVEGDAVWGSHDPQRVEGGAVHTGDFVANAVPHGDRLQLAAEDGVCRLRVRLLGPYLLVDDNLNCGGANVSFGGTYRRR